MSTRDYEAMFILDHTAATEDFDAATGNVEQILEKHGATIDTKEKWDERKLAYEIKGQRRGTYFLVYFSADPQAIEKINEDVQLNETILRHLVIALDVPIAEHIETTAVERERLAEDSRKNSLGGWGGRRDRRAGSARKGSGDDRSDDDDSDDDAPPAKRSDAKGADAKGADAKDADGDKPPKKEAVGASASKETSADATTDSNDSE